MLSASLVMTTLINTLSTEAVCLSFIFNYFHFKILYIKNEKKISFFKFYFWLCWVLVAARGSSLRHAGSFVWHAVFSL